MINEYKYTLKCEPSVVSDIIILNDILRPLFDGISYSEKKDGSIEELNLKIKMNKVLLLAEETELIGLINSYGPENMFVQRDIIKREYVTPNQSWAMDFIMEMGANNVQREKTGQQVATLMSAYAGLMMAAIGGSVPSIYAVVCSMVADDNISQEEINEFKKRLEIKLGIA